MTLPRQPVLCVPGVPGLPKTDLGATIVDIITGHGGVVGRLSRDYFITAVMPTEKHAHSCMAEISSRFDLISIVEESVLDEEPTDGG